jgi:hypothetical protein
VVSGDGVDDELNSTLDLPAPNATPFCLYFVLRQVGWTASDGICGATATQSVIIGQIGASPALTMYNGTANVNSSVGAPVGTFARVAAQFTGSTSDFMKAGSAASSTGVSAGVLNPSATFTLLRYGVAAVFANVDIACLVVLQGTFTPGAGAFAALDAAVALKYGGIVVI